MKFWSSEESTERPRNFGKITYPHFVPDIIITLKHGEVMLDWHDETVSIHQLLGQSTREVDPRAHGNYWRLWYLVVLAEAEGTSREDLLRSLII